MLALAHGSRSSRSANKHSHRKAWSRGSLTGDEADLGGLAHPKDPFGEVLVAGEEALLVVGRERDGRAPLEAHGTPAALEEVAESQQLDDDATSATMATMVVDKNECITPDAASSSKAPASAPLAKAKSRSATMFGSISSHFSSSCAEESAQAASADTTRRCRDSDDSSLAGSTPMES